MSSPSYYERLQVSPHATHEEIRGAYRRLAQLHHPDANPGAPDAARALMAELNDAWAVLGDPDKRVAYDRRIGTTPRPRPFVYDEAAAAGEGDPDGDDAPFRLSDEPYVARKSRPSDLLVATPIFLAITAIALFFFSVMSESDGLRTASLTMVPVTAGTFVAAPLFVMLRSRDRDRD